MSELTDLEICKRIAEIEGFEFRVQNGKVLPEDPSEVITSKLTDVYNPLTDKALCFDLMVKYRIDFESTDWSGEEWEAAYWFNDNSDIAFIYDKDPQRAICLAIIAKHEDNK